MTESADKYADGVVAHETMGPITHSIWVKVQGEPEVPGSVGGDSLWVCVYSIYERNRGTTRPTAGADFRVVGSGLGHAGVGRLRLRAFRVQLGGRDMTLGYENPVHRFRVGDVVRIGSGKVEWTITGKGATTGLSVKNEAGRARSTSTHEVALIRRAED